VIDAGLANVAEVVWHNEIRDWKVWVEHAGHTERTFSVANDVLETIEPEAIRGAGPLKVVITDVKVTRTKVRSRRCIEGEKKRDEPLR
jgi:hypothetical protein